MQETARKRLLAFKEMVHPTFRSTLSSGLLEWYRNRESSHKRRLEEREVFHFFEKKKKVHRRNTFFYIARDWFLACGQLRIFFLRLYFMTKFIKAADSNYKVHFKMHFYYFMVHIIRFQMGMGAI